MPSSTAAPMAFAAVEVLPAPGGVLHADCRPEAPAVLRAPRIVSGKSCSPSFVPDTKLIGAGWDMHFLQSDSPVDAVDQKPAGTVRIVQWNIERGYQLPRIIALLRALDADILSLQEVDIGCERSRFVDTGLEIARVLGLNYVFATEFEELHSPVREAHVQGGGVHGNAILTKFDIDLDNVYCLKHSHQPFNWASNGHIYREPRRGERSTLVVQVNAPGGPVLCYSTHMELFCGLLDRVIIFSDILEDARRQSKRCPAQTVFGDFNTLAHGIARFSPNYCLDYLRFGSLGLTESEWWESVLLSFQDSEGSVHQPLKTVEMCRHLLSLVLGTRAGPTLSPEVLSRARNPGFHDPFDQSSDITLSNYRGWYTGKLDWALLRGLSSVRRGIANHSYTASDHKLLFVDVTPADPSNPSPFRHRPRITLVGTLHPLLLFLLGCLALLLWKLAGIVLRL